MIVTKCIVKPAANDYLLHPYKIGEEVIVLDVPIDPKYGTERSRETYLTVQRKNIKDSEGNKLKVIEVMSKHYFANIK